MRYRNTLTDLTTSSALVVTEPVEVYVQLGVAESNTYVGSSQMLSRVWARHTLTVGDEIHDLPGGVFAVLDGVRRPVTVALDDKHPFEKRYQPRVEQWPADKLRLLGPPTGDLPVDRGRTYLPSEVADATRVGRGIDLVLAAAFS